MFLRWWWLQSVRVAIPSRISDYPIALPVRDRLVLS